MNTNDHIEEQELDGLLKDVFLSADHSDTGAMSAGFILSQNYDVTIDLKKEKELLARLKGKDTGRSGRNIFFGLLAGGVILTCTWFFLKKDNRSDQAGVPKITAQVDVPVPPVQVNTSPTVTIIEPPDYFPKRNEIKSVTIFSPPAPDVHSFSEISYETDVAVEKQFFSEKELNHYCSMKINVLEKLFSLDKDLYRKVEEGKVPYKDGELGVDAFVIRKYAITNLEYKTFVADLIRSGRTAEANKIMVRSMIWKAYNYPTLGDHYFSDAKYDGFPVVNVSREGAALFCVWLEKEMNTLMKTKDPKAREVKVRLPYDYEWIYTARVGYAQIPDCGGYNTIYDPSEGLIDKTFLKRMNVVKKHNDKPPVYADQFFNINRFGMNEKEIMDIFDKGLLYQNQYSADTLYPSGIDVFGKTGHVSEIIQNPGGKTVIMGSCWKSKDDYKKMVEEFQNDQGSPFIGFRVVITNASKGTYKDPFW